jgi:hypothetical protein
MADDDYPPLTVAQLVAQIKRQEPDPGAIVHLRVQTSVGPPGSGVIYTEDALLRHIYNSAQHGETPWVELEGRVEWSPQTERNAAVEAVVSAVRRLQSADTEDDGSAVWLARNALDDAIDRLDALEATVTP